VLDRPRLQIVTRRGVVGGGAPPGVPRPRPPWFSSDQQYEEFLNRTAHDLGAQSITATSIDVEHLDEDHRKELLAGCSLRPTVGFVCGTFGRLDDAALFSRDGAFEKQFLRGLTGDLGRRVQKPLANGSRLMPPAAMTQLIREVIEWCPDTTA
jgi:hypothetical protein